MLENARLKHCHAIHVDIGRADAARQQIREAGGTRAEAEDAAAGADAGAGAGSSDALERGASCKRGRSVWGSGWEGAASGGGALGRLPQGSSPDRPAPKHAPSVTQHAFACLQGASCLAPLAAVHVA